MDLDQQLHLLNRDSQRGRNFAGGFTAPVQPERMRAPAQVGIDADRPARIMINQCTGTTLVGREVRIQPSRFCAAS
jgi:hypothetical protein